MNEIPVMILGSGLTMPQLPGHEDTGADLSGKASDGLFHSLLMAALLPVNPAQLPVDADGQQAAGELGGPEEPGISTELPATPAVDDGIRPHQDASLRLVDHRQPAEAAIQPVVIRDSLVDQPEWREDRAFTVDELAGERPMPEPAIDHLPREQETQFVADARPAVVPTRSQEQRQSSVGPAASGAAIPLAPEQEAAPAQGREAGPADPVEAGDGYPPPGFAVNAEATAPAGPVRDSDEVVLEQVQASPSDGEVTTSNDTGLKATLLRRGDHRLAIRLADQDLGSIWVDLQRHGQRIDIGFRAAELATAELLDTNLDQLLAGLRHRRIEVGQALVDHWQPGWSGQDRQQSPGDPGSGSRRRKDSGPPRPVSSSEAADQPASVAAPPVTTGLNIKV